MEVRHCLKNTQQEKLVSHWIWSFIEVILYCFKKIDNSKRLEELDCFKKFGGS